ncbi:macrolide-binding protein FKBP12 [Trichosporon asahii var. asahii CBS 2479]|uniref:peptidylprolyl isomerase n=1 Tax=Trichosporon asahii var. asahii (strain ATCC 90039 / CBS 2479 / JCM 2466 / KCTC 7840 / NBRC 103889/ NCYC 2677 / UAMH 7654) TaxID=1186058 RepID=J5QGX8_TRIAS|nr:macrolide-binding protein FKBP12 [Trichosporon asahii var. asahii CBS 2479]EJT47298.1 macrolide-binding protein FKBP12 [Trichosporon asahii var. asahii CBS 2479]
MFKSVLPTATRALRTSNLTATRSFHTTLSRMGVTVDKTRGGELPYVPSVADSQVIKPGDGKTFPKKGDKVTIHYVGTLTDGSKFDSSRDRGSPFQCTIGVGQVIKGWDEGVPQLSLGEKAVLTATPDYAYGARGFPPVIPPNSTLKFEVELLKIN